VSRAARRQAGFTTVEILVALAVVSMVAAAVASYMRGPPASVRVQSEARHVAAVLQRLRADAMTSQVERRFIVDPDGRRYGAEGGTLVEIPDDISISADMAGGRGREGSVRFFPSGTSSGATIRLKLGGSSATILVNWATGAISVEGPAS
jgi:general secretion pathway protein H